MQKMVKYLCSALVSNVVEITDRFWVHLLILWRSICWGRWKEKPVEHVTLLLIAHMLSHPPLHLLSQYWDPGSFPI